MASSGGARLSASGAVVERDNPVSHPRRRAVLRGPGMVALLLIAPALFLRIVTSAWPFFNTIWLSLFRSNPTLGPDKFIGPRNFEQLLSDPQVQATTFFTIFYTVVSTGLELVIGLLIALLLASSGLLQRPMRALNLIPWAIPIVVTGIAFRFGLDTDFGLFADMWRRLTGASVDFLLSAWPARWSVVGTNVWRNAPFVAVLLLAALQTVPEDLYEAAKLDGARPLQAFWSITLPMILPVVLATGTFFMIWQIASFDLVLAMTGGGPGNATQVLGYKAYLDGFGSLNFGRSAALSLMLCVVVAALGLLGTLGMRLAERRRD